LIRLQDFLDYGCEQSQPFFVVIWQADRIWRDGICESSG